MKILFIIDQYDNDNNGTVISAKRFANVLRQFGHEVRFVSPGVETEEKYAVRKLNIPFFNGIIEKQGMTLGKPCKVVLRKAIEWADVVHFLMPFWLSYKGRQIAEEMGVPNTAAFHVQPENISYSLGFGKSKLANKLLYKFFKKFFNKFNHVHCPSPFIASELEKYGYNAKLHIISNGINECFVYRKLPKPPAEAQKIIIVMIGRLSNEKRQDLLIDAVKKSKYSEKIQLVLAGKGPKHKKYEKLGSKLTNPVIIKFFSQQELLDLLAMADLYVHASDAEIEGISCIEAFASGLVPVISDSIKSATKQFALDERSLFKNGCSDDLALKIDYWLDNEKERKNMEIKYAEHGKQFGIETYVKKFENMLLEAYNVETDNYPSLLS